LVKREQVFEKEWKIRDHKLHCLPLPNQEKHTVKADTDQYSPILETNVALIVEQEADRSNEEIHLIEWMGSKSFLDWLEPKVVLRTTGVREGSHIDVLSSPEGKGLMLVVYAQ